MMQKYIAQAIVWGVALLIAAILLVVGAGFLGAAVYFALCPRPHAADGRARNRARASFWRRSSSF